MADRLGAKDVPSLVIVKAGKIVDVLCKDLSSCKLEDLLNQHYVCCCSK